MTKSLSTIKLQTSLHDGAKAISLVALDANFDFEEKQERRGIVYFGGIPLVEVCVKEKSVVSVRMFYPLFMALYDDAWLYETGCFEETLPEAFERTLAEHGIMPSGFYPYFGNSLQKFRKTELGLTWEAYIQALSVRLEKLYEEKLLTQTAPELFGNPLPERLAHEIKGISSKRVRELIDLAKRNIQRKNKTKDKVLTWRGESYCATCLVPFMKTEVTGDLFLLMDSDRPNATGVIPFLVSEDGIVSADPNLTQFFTYADDYPIQSSWLKGKKNMTESDFLSLFLDNPEMHEPYIREGRLGAEFWFYFCGLGGELQLMRFLGDLRKIPWLHTRKPRERNKVTTHLYAILRYGEVIGYAS